MEVDLETQRSLFAEFPRAFRRPSGKASPGPIDVYGIECGAGWLALVRPLCAQMESEIDVLSATQPDRARWPRFVQIKEKFGLLRVYVFGDASQELRAEILRAEEASGFVCAECGLLTTRRLLPLCDACVSKAAGVDAAPLARYQKFLADLSVILSDRSE